MILTFSKVWHFLVVALINISIPGILLLTKIAEALGHSFKPERKIMPITQLIATQHLQNQIHVFLSAVNYPFLLCFQSQIHEPVINLRFTFIT